MRAAIYRTEDPTLETIELGAVYSIRASSTGGPRALYRIPVDCGVDSIKPPDVPTGWDGAYEYVMGDARIRPHIARLARDTYIANADLEVAIVPVGNEETDAGSRALLHRFTCPY